MKYQIIAVSKGSGLIFGNSYKDPFAALREFIKHSKSTSIDELFFHECNRNTVYTYSDRLVFASICTNFRGDTFVEFHTDSTMEDAKDLLDRFYHEASHSPNFVSFMQMSIVDMKTGDVAFAYSLNRDSAANCQKVENTGDSVTPKELLARQNDRTTTTTLSLMAQEVIEQAKKKGTEEILQKLYDEADGMNNKTVELSTHYIKNTLAKEYGVEIK